MKNFALTTLLTISFVNIMAKEIPQYDETYINKINNDYKSLNFEQENKIVGLEQNYTQMQKSYDDKINFLVNELEKTKARLVEKSLNEEKIQASIKEKYEVEINYLKKELISKTRTVLEYQRQIEKINPTEDTKHLIQINTDLAAELRKTEGQLAVIELEYRKDHPTNLIPKSGKGGDRMPASVSTKALEK